MNYRLLKFWAMPFNRSLPFDWGGYFVGNANDKDTWIKKLSKDDFSEKDHVNLHYNVYSYFKDCIYFYHSSDKHIKKLDIETLEISDAIGPLFPKHNWGSLNCYHNLETKQYEIFKEERIKVFEFKYNYPISTNFIESGILLYQNNDKEKNWIKCLNPNGGKEKWKLEFHWQIVRLEVHKSMIVLEYQAYENIRADKGYEGERDWYNPNRFTIVIDVETGEEIWRHPFAYTKIDHNNNVILSGSRIVHSDDFRVFEFDINTGEIKTNKLVVPKVRIGCIPHFVDDEGIYYLSSDHSFGKISKADGKILWEFDLKDQKGEKRKLSDWLLLENGKLVLQAMPNHPNGDLMCIFDPIENLDFSNVKNGKRVDLSDQNENES